MARPLRLERAGARYHVTARGNERRRIFRSDEDRVLFLETLRQMIERFGIVLHVYCLMPNHYHLVIGTPRGNLTRAMGWFQTTYTIRYNRRHQRVGHLFQGRFKAHLVGADLYAKQLVLYIHLNPARPKDKARPIPHEKRKDLEEYPWSSHRAYSGTGQRPDWLNLDWLSSWGNDRREAQGRYRQEMKGLFGKKADSPWTGLRGGLVLGGETLWKRVKGTVHDKKGQEEIRWQKHEGNRERRKRLETCLAKENDKRVKIWARVRLGGERLVDVGREMGYQNGSGVLQVVKRLEEYVVDDKKLKKKVDLMKESMSSVES
jgi:REP element-mobilizing transposase RayT